ncbi:MAG: hypothetical protein SOZ02_10770 [Hallerella porci]|uniref:Uncharacterized protein n=1 Tax=Hallerella porci TaxID=1945871 RepID=A0ABX5LSF6_9BACT|nr:MULTISPECIES: hypothetical protein [Hallerella]MCI5600409.1 hypothetical protein [Hallerella sp.]MDY3922626.1 hypothetical protein [Hallerella porci]PWL04295.1 hypothetical protein B0H50_101310 [Hallerella porci]
MKFLRRFLLSSLFGATFAFANENGEASADSLDSSNSSPKEESFQVDIEHNLNFLGFYLPHSALRNSGSLKSWPFFAFAFPLSWTSSISLDKKFGKLLSINTDFSGDLNVFGTSVRAMAATKWMGLLDLGIIGSVTSAFNYSSSNSSIIFMGVYNPEKKELEGDNFGTEALFDVKYFATLTIPLMSFLPKSDWTKIMIKPSASLTNLYYTGAEDGEFWKVGNEYSANGYRYSYGATLIYLLPFKYFPSAMVKYTVSGIVHESDYDAVYDPYDPGFKEITITPMLSVQFNEKWSGLLMVNIERERKFRHYHYDSDEELLQERVGSDWTIPHIIFLATRTF